MDEFNGTAHINAKLGDIAKTVLMPGDPLRAKYIAETFLESPKQFNGVRGMLGFTGTYKGNKVSVMGSGMGMPSIGIYSYELYKFYGVENIIRIGSAGAYTDSIDLYDVVLATGAYSQSSYAKVQNGNSDEIITATESLNRVIEATAKELDENIQVGLIHSSDVFYEENPVNPFPINGSLCVEMESFALFSNAKILGKNAACLVTISDNLVTHQHTTPEERQSAFVEMMEIALNSAIKL